MANALGPYFVRIFYHSPQAPHVMTLPTKTWSPDGGAGNFATWDASSISASVMVNALVDVLKTLYPSDCVFDSYGIYSQPTPADDVVPLYAEAVTTGTGTSVDGSWASASELIFVARSTNFGIAKLTLLDAVTSNQFLPMLTLSGLYADVFAEWSDEGNGWAARDNGRPATFLKMTTNINQALRKEYRYD
jgi:hypothetical protein